MRLQAGSDDVSVQRVEDEEVLQGKFAAELAVQLQQSLDAKPSDTGLPNNLKAGVESLSGLSLDNVKVHYNSSEPAQLNANAYAQGTDIYVGSGQEQHLPHEAWHVVQQAQGRVNPTMQMKDGVSVNDDQGLEAEADLMGVRALSSGVVQARHEVNSIESDSNGPAIQRYTVGPGSELISENEKIILESDRSKNLYSTAEGFTETQASMLIASMGNVSVKQGPSKVFDFTGSSNSYKKIEPDFVNVKGNAGMESSPVQQDIITDNQAALDARWKIVDGIAITLNSILPACMTPAWVTGNRSSSMEAHAQIRLATGSIPILNDYMQKLGEVKVILDNIQVQIDLSNFDLSVLQPMVALDPTKRSILGETTYSLLLNKWHMMAKKGASKVVKAQLDLRRGELTNSLSVANQRKPLLTTDCKKLAVFLKGDNGKTVNVDNSSALPDVGDTYETNLPTKLEDAQWTYHYATVLMQDGDDRITLEDAATQTGPIDVDHWYFMMYGTNKGQSFLEKTEAAHEMMSERYRKGKEKEKNKKFH